MSRVRASAAKPNFEVGSSSQIKLSFGKNTVKPGMFISPVLYLLRLKVNFILYLSNLKTPLCVYSEVYSFICHMWPSQLAAGQHFYDNVSFNG